MQTLSRKLTLLLIGAALTGCLANSTTSRTTSRLSRGKPAPDTGKAAPDISGIDADRKEFQLSDYRGKVVLLDFWASW